MGSATFLTEIGAAAVIDTSAAINLTATGCAAQILQALPFRLAATDTVPLELEEGRRRGRRDADLFHELVSGQFLEVVALGNHGAEIFESLVLGKAAETLDDGEAATIAYAVERGATAIIDERKANRICGERFPSLRVGSTVDLLSHPDVLNVLGRNRLADAVFSALTLARMRIFPHHVDWVIELIGTEQANQCTSLPRSLRRSQPALVGQSS